jgi:hypothetical protein
MWSSATDSVLSCSCFELSYYFNSGRVSESLACAVFLFLFSGACGFRDASQAFNVGDSV